MVWVRVAFHENDGNHENDENDDDNSDSYKQGVEYWIRENHGNHENDENHENPGCKPRVPQTTGLEMPDILGPMVMRGAKSPANNLRTISPSVIRICCTPSITLADATVALSALITCGVCKIRLRALTSYLLNCRMAFSNSVLTKRGFL